MQDLQNFLERLDAAKERHDVDVSDFEADVRTFASSIDESFEEPTAKCWAFDRLLTIYSLAQADAARAQQAHTTREGA